MIERTQGVGSQDEAGRAKERRAAAGCAATYEDASAGIETAEVETVDEQSRDTGDAVRNAVSNTMKSVGAVGGNAIGVTRDVLNDAIAATEDVGSNLVGGVAHLAKDLVHGVRDVGGDVANVVKEGATGTINAVGDIGGNTVHTLTHLLVDAVGGIGQIAGAAVGGVKTVVGEALPRSSSRVERPSVDEVAVPQPPSQYQPPQRQPTATQNL